MLTRYYQTDYPDGHMVPVHHGEPLDPPTTHWCKWEDVRLALERRDQVRVDAQITTLSREQITVTCYEGEDYRLYHGTRLLATVYALPDVVWLLDRDADIRRQLATAQETITRLGEVANNTVPRSRYDAVNQDWLDKIDELGDVRKAAKKELDILMACVTAMKAQLAQKETP